MGDGSIEYKTKYLKKYKIFNLFLQWVHQEEAVIKSLEEFKRNLS